jgi:2-oxoglutarate dehydrogenase E2 component (dihydrolipoamide succinyltransferase)
MPLEVKVPEVGESVSEIYVGQWRKAAGDAVEVDEPLVELESDKATLDVPAPAGGVLTKILKLTGESAEVGEVIGLVEEAGQAEAPDAQKRAAEDREPPKAKEGDGRAPEKPRAKPKPPEEHASRAPSARPASRAPSARPASAGRAGATQSRQEPTRTREPSHPAPESLEPSPAPDRREDRVPMSPVRRRIAQRLVEAQQSAALLTTFNEIDMSAVKQLRAGCGNAFERKHGVRLGFMSFFVKASIDALKECRELNAVVDDNQIVYRQYYDIGVAVSTDRGLVVPVLRNADAMSFAEIELTIDDIAKRARAGDLHVEELQGGTFTITNGGVFGSLLSTPIVNPPQSGVLGMHAIQDRPVARGKRIVVRPMMYVALTYDHRLVDGREAVTFLRRVKEAVESPARLLLEV